MRTSGIPHSAHVHDANSRKTGEWLNPNDREQGVLESAIRKEMTKSGLEPGNWVIGWLSGGAYPCWSSGKESGDQVGFIC